METRASESHWRVTDRTRGDISLAMVCALVLTLAGCGLVFWSVSAESAFSRSERTQVPTPPNSPVPDYETRPIRDIRTGHRVMADNPELSDLQVEEADIAPAIWRNVSLQMTKEDGGILDIVLLRPLDWLNAYACKIGGTVHLDLREFGAIGPAQVLSIDPCPPIEDGPGRVVTATFAHSSADILDIHVEGVSDPIGTTANHPFWSEDRQAFVAAGSLDVGEHLLLADGGRASVLSIEHRTNAEPVFNIEVDGEHVYHVSRAGVLVHNTCATQRILSHLHHTIPLGIQRRLAEAGNKIAGHADIVGRAGLPNRRRVAEFVHRWMHSGRGYVGNGNTGIGGGHYSNMFHREILKRGGYQKVTRLDILAIRDELVVIFGI